MKMTEAKKVAFLLAKDFEDSEMVNPYEEMVKNGHETVIIGLEAQEELTGKQGTVTYTTHLGIKDAHAADYDAIIIPGGSSPGYLMYNEDVNRFVREADREGKTIAAICHGPQVLAAAGVLEGRTLTAFPGISSEIEAVGGKYLNREVVVDRNLVTSRVPEDEPAFIRETVERLGVNAW
ncbi:protease [Paenibacillus sp. MY03]|nr:protease [Paenibacillus sp. MY03]QNK55006.1 type 1 glutamine amidotransferase [Paenibacillus sp. PAMC21692]